MRSHITRTLMALLASCLLVVSSLAGAKQVLRIANMGEPASLDPHFMSGTWENNIAGNMFLALLTEDAKGDAIAGAAESWTVSDDGKVYTFTLRDHTWSDGVPVTAQDFEFAFRRVLDPKTAAEYASLLYIIKNAEAVNTGKLPPEELGVKALDKKTLRIELNGPAPYFLSQLTHYTAYPLPAHVVKKYGKDWTKAEHMVSNGAYTLVEWLPNTHVKLKKNPKFYDADNVAIDEIIYYPQEDRAAVLKRFRAGEVDITRDFPSDQIDWLKKNLPEETRIAPYLGTYYYPINTAKAPFNDVRVRKALSMAINREILTEKVLKTGEIPAYSFVPPGTANYGEPAYVDWKDMPYKERVKQAKALLAEAGFGPDKPLTFQLRYNTSENHKRIAIAVAQMWKQLGVKV
ncbi:MAG: peptide ABC transporter substrate-binding protein, partial [Gammaproteobacteria bacterium]